MRMFSETFEQIERNYVKGVDRRRLVEAAIRECSRNSTSTPTTSVPTRFPGSSKASASIGGIGIQVRPDLVVATRWPEAPPTKRGSRPATESSKSTASRPRHFPRTESWKQPFR
ncbi:MAG: hypothetical protein CM1200mP2_23180 [Planctomycetaceae bacterium]|nr:MAG: hypothetical protein CM1200mP2_23180 [Planctomycetaceae bacterium]